MEGSGENHEKKLDVGLHGWGYTGQREEMFCLHFLSMAGGGITTENKPGPRSLSKVPVTGSPSLILCCGGYAGHIMYCPQGG